MATFTGTEGADTLAGTNIDLSLIINPVRSAEDDAANRNLGRDAINALGGDDLIIGSTGSDSIDGGAGNDTIDFSNLGQGIFLSDNGAGVDTSGFSRRFPPSASENYVSATTKSVEIFIGDPTQSNTINDFSRYNAGGRNTKIDVDLATGQVTYFGIWETPISYSVKNFDNVRTPSSSGKFVGNDRNNDIQAGDGSVIIGSKGTDELTGQTIDYSNLGKAVKFSTNGTINKGDFGNDKISRFQKVVGAVGKTNTLDASSSASLDLNLANNLLKSTNTEGIINQIEVVNFVNAIGGKGNDTIVGNNQNSTLTGSGGNDTITGGSKNDRLTGTDSTARGVGEVDTLTGSGGRDKFILGDRNGAYYLGNAANDYALITDFNLAQDSIDIGSLKDYSFAQSTTGTFDLFSGKDPNTRDLIARIQIADAGAAFASKGSGLSKSMSFNSSMMAAGASNGVDVISSKIDILSGADSIADATI
jgi:Ca2+-binding RTX toxin-like protein